jgi:hypothetical protein
MGSRSAASQFTPREDSMTDKPQRTTVTKQGRPDDSESTGISATTKEGTAMNLEAYLSLIYRGQLSCLRERVGFDHGAARWRHGRETVQSQTVVVDAGNLKAGKNAAWGYGGRNPK